MTTHYCPACGHTYHTFMPPTIRVRCHYEGHPVMDIVPQEEDTA